MPQIEKALKDKDTYAHVFKSFWISGTFIFKTMTKMHFSLTKEGICIGLYVYKRHNNVLHIFEKGVSMQRIFEGFLEKQRRLCVLEFL